MKLKVNQLNHFDIKRETENGDLYLQGWSPAGESKAVICLVHGLGEHSGRYSDLARFFNRNNFSLIAIDLPGHGKSFGPRGHISSYKVMMDMVAILLEEGQQRFSGLPCFLYGHSMGGNLVVNYALRKNPGLEGLIVSAPWLKLDPDPPFVKAMLGRLMNHLVPQFSQTNDIEPDLLTHDEKIVEQYSNDPLVHDQISARLFVEVSSAGKQALENASKIDLPMLMMAGTEDKMVSFEAVREFSQKVSADCTFKSWDGFYHEVHNEIGKTEVYSYLLDWLKNRLKNSIF